MPRFHELTLTTLDDTAMPLQQFRGRPVLVVNVASQCGLTPQYAGLQALYQELGPQGLVIIGAPCNQFGGQEPGSAGDIQRFCTSRYDVSFPLTRKLEVNGPGRHPLYQYLVGEGENISWNFEKFLVAGDGAVIARFPPPTAPEDPALRQAIEAALQRPTPPLA